MTGSRGEGTPAVAVTVGVARNDRDVTSSGGCHTPVIHCHVMKTPEKLFELAERQHGVVALRQLFELGATPAAARHLRNSSRLEATPARGVYRVRGTRPTWQQSLMVLVLACGPGAAASHRAAGALLSVPRLRPGVVEVVTVRPWRQRVEAAEVHSSRWLPAGQVVVADDVPATTVPRTIADLAGMFHPRRLERLVDDCLAANLVTVPALWALLDEMPTRGRRGVVALRGLLDERDEGYTPPASELEAAFRDLCREAGLPQPVRQFAVGDRNEWVGRVDVAYPDHRLIIELDSRRYHTARLDLESDRRRDNRLVAAGWRVVRITWDQLVRQPSEVVDLLHRLLGLAVA